MQVRAGCSNNMELNPTTTTQFEFIPRAALMPVAMIAALCTPTVLVLILSWSLVVVVGVVCMLLLHPTLTCADLCTLHPDLCTLCLQWLSSAATYGGGVSPSAVCTNTPLAHAPIAICTGGVFSSTHWHARAQILYLHSSSLHCVVASIYKLLSAVATF